MIFAILEGASIASDSRAMGTRPAQSYHQMPIRSVRHRSVFGLCFESTS